MNTNQERGNREGLGRRQAVCQMLGLVGLSDWAASNPPELQAWLEHVHEVAEQKQRHRPLAEGSLPRFFTSQEFKTLSAIVERILPRTETPGAVDAGVHWYLDIVVAGEPGLQGKFRDGLASLDGRSKKQFGRTFSQLKQAEQIQMLESMVPGDGPGHAFFATVKAMTVVGYYSSEMGLYEELQFVDNEYKDEFLGCTHAGHPLEPPAKRGARSDSSASAEQWPFPTRDNITGEDL